ncbi:unnamed protein product [Gongylonema pulchrum]|uniref:Cadherin domain-containing protein n=1 Tax=Gongylonema pulchrum TaxID=637853 RepID=A0A3P7NKD0_9BILA|nr:unnamed protein product [Gongylonema pulchrum]
MRERKHGKERRKKNINFNFSIKFFQIQVHTFPRAISLSVPENAPLGTIITNLAPSNESQRFEFQKPGTPDDYPIRILPSGEVYVASEIDRETLEYFSIPVTAITVDKDGFSSKQDFVLRLYIEDLNDNAPECPEQNRFVVSENNIPGAIVGVFSAIDRDSGLNGTVFYELMYDNSKIFNIDRNSGVIRVLSILDFETTQSYNITVLATDGGSLKTKCTAVIEVIDLNDNAPQWDRKFYHFNTSATIDNGTFIGTLMAQDGDSRRNAEIRYKLRQKWMPFKAFLFA